MQAFEIRYATKIVGWIILFIMLFLIGYIAFLFLSDQSLTIKFINGITIPFTIWVLYRGWKKMSTRNPIVIMNKEGIQYFNGGNYELFLWSDIETRVEYESGEGTFLYITTPEKTHQINLNWTGQNQKTVNAAITLFRSS